MPYSRPDELPPEKTLVDQFERAIKSLVRRFRNHPFCFYTETDMHCYLYHQLYKKPFNELYKTSEGFDTILLHKEFPTNAKYRRQNDQTLKTDPNSKRRGRFDIAIWDPEYVSSRRHRKQQVLCAAELALNECGPKNIHTINDSTKLADPKNEIRYGYLLYFVRDEGIKQYEKNKKRIRQQLEDAAKRVNVAFALVDGTSKPKPLYLGRWQTA